MRFRITNPAPNTWRVEREVTTQGWFWHKQEWQYMDSFFTQDKAIEHVKKMALYEPHTSHYDKYGNLEIEDTDW